MKKLTLIIPLPLVKDNDFIFARNGSYVINPYFMQPLEEIRIFKGLEKQCHFTIKP